MGAGGAGEGQAAGVEGHGEKRGLVHVNQVAGPVRAACIGDIAGVKAPALDGLPFAGRERNDINVRVVVACAYLGGRRKQGRLTPRENLRPAVGSFAGRQLRHRYRHPAGGRNARERAGEVQRRDDVAIVAPASAKAKGRVAQRDRRAAFHRDLLQLAIGKEPDPIACRRKERPVGVLGAGQRH